MTRLPMMMPTMIHLPNLLAAFNAATGGADPSPSPTPTIKDIVPPQPYFLPINYLLVVLGAVALALVGWLVWRFFLKPLLQRPPTPLTARQAAAARLEELRQRAPVMDANIFGAEVCDVLRLFIGAERGLHPERQTSPEFLSAIAGSVRFTPDEHLLLADFLTQCDLLKFARLDAELPAKERLIEQAADFVAGTGAKVSPDGMPPPLPPMGARGVQRVGT